MTETEAAMATRTDPALRPAAADALEWLHWLRDADMIGEFARRRRSTQLPVDENRAALGRAIAALEAALEEQP